MEDKIRFLHREEIDIAKWDDTITNAHNTRLYGLSWYLDIMIDKSWSAIIWGDYDAVFPVLSKKVTFLTYLTQPYLCQQLGIFTNRNQDIQDYIAQVIKYLKCKFLKTDVLIKADFAEKPNINRKTNHLLLLDKPYEVLKNNYNRNTKRNIQKSEKIDTLIRESIDIQEFVQFMSRYDKSQIIKTIRTQIDKLTKCSLEKQIGKVLIAEYNNETLAACFYIEFQNRIYFLLCTSSEKGIENNSMYALIDHIIKQNADTNKILDFTGSSIENIARRNLGFGAKIETYFHLKTKWMPF